MSKNKVTRATRRAARTGDLPPLRGRTPQQQEQAASTENAQRGREADAARASVTKNTKRPSGSDVPLY